MMRTRYVLFALILLLSALLPVLSIEPAVGANYTVTFTADNTTAGSLRWAITQANSTAGAHTIAFNIPRADPGFYSENATHGWWRIQLNSALPNVTRANLYIDGATQAANQGDTNPGYAGTGGTVGTDNLALPRYERPEIELCPATITSVSNGFTTSADNTTIRGFAIYGFGGSGASITNAQVRLTGGNNLLVENCLLGSRASGADPGFDSKTAGIYISSVPTGTVRNNYVGYNIMGIYFQGAHHWTITGNEFFQNALRYAAYDGMDMASATNNITVRGNLVRQSGGTGIDTYNATGNFTIENNTINTSGAANGNERCGIRLFGSGSTVSRNIVTSNGGAGMIVPSFLGTIYSENNTFSRNSCYSNTGLGLDLIRLGSATDRGDGVNFNDGIYVDSWGNRGVDFPVLTSASLAGNILNLAGYVGNDASGTTFRNCTLEFFTAATDPTGYGEGRTYLGSYPMPGAGNSFTCVIDVTGKGLLGTDSVTATATDTMGNTSEFCLCRQLSVVQNPVLSLSVTPPAYGYAGQNVTYSGVVRNVSTSTAYNNVLTWQLPNEFTYVSSSGGTYDPVTRTVSISVPSISAGQEITGYVTVNINAGVPDATLVTTSSRLTWQNQFGNPLGPVEHSSSIVVYSTPQLTTQLFPPSYAFAGENILYTGVLHNYSNGTAINTVLTFQLPAGMSFVSASRAAVVNGDNVTFNLGNVAPGAEMNGSMTVHIDGATPDGTVLHLVTLLTWQDAAGNSYGPQERYYDLTVYQRPQLTITKEGPPDAVIGSNYTFTGTLANVGSGPAENVVLIDYLPVGLTFVSSSHSAVYNPGDRTVTWQLGRVSSGSSIPGWITVLVDNTTPNGSKLINNFQASWSDNLSNPYGPISASREITAYSSPQLTITKEGPDEATVGSYITFTGTVTNVGGLPAENVTLTDYLPTGLSFVGSSHGAVYDPATRTITWQLGRVDSGVALPGWITVQVDSSVTNGSRLTNNFAVTWKDGGGNSFGPANANKQVIARTNPLLSISKTGPEYGRPGHNLTFTISLANFGGLNAQNITLVDTLPDKYFYVSSSPAGAYSGGNVIWSLGSLASGADTSVSLTVLVDNTTANNTPLANGAMVTWKDGQGNTFGPTSTSFTTTIYSVPHLLMNKSGPPTANPGDNCTYTISLANTSDAAALNTTLNDILPTGMSFISCSDSGTYNPLFGMVSWNLGTVAGTGSRSVTITLAVDPSLTQETALTDSAAVNWQDALGSSYGPSVANFSTLVSPFPDLSISITGPSSGRSGTALTFTVRVTNNSDTMAANNVFAQFIVPSGCTYSSSSDGGTYSGGTVTWNLGSLAALASRQLTVIIIPVSAPVGSDVISTSATVWQYPAGSTHGPLFATVNTRIEAAPPPPPPPPPPEPNPTPPAITPYSSASVTSITNPPPMQMPYIYIENASLSTSQVEPNSPVQVLATVANKGPVNGSAKITLYVNGYEEPGQGVILAGGQSRTLTFYVARSEPGTYLVYVNGTSAGSFTVSDNSGGNAILVISSLCLLGALFIAIVMLMRRKQSYS